MSARWTRMRRAVVTLAAAALLVMIAAAPAFAQRDPFDPLVTQNSGSAVDDTGNSVGGSSNNAPDSNDSQPSNDPGALPTTGSDIDGWLAAAYLLVAAGAAAIVVARTNSTEPTRITK